MRLLAAVLSVALVFAAIVLTLNSLEFADGPLCSDKQAAVREAARTGGSVECYEGSAERRVVTVACRVAGSICALIAAGIGFSMAATSRASRYLMPFTGAALLLGGASVLTANL